MFSRGTWAPIQWFTTAYMSSSRGLDALLWTLWAPGMYTHLIHIIKKSKNNLIMKQNRENPS